MQRNPSAYIQLRLYETKSLKLGKFCVRIASIRSLSWLRKTLVNQMKACFVDTFVCIT